MKYQPIKQSGKSVSSSFVQSVLKVSNLGMTGNRALKRWPQKTTMDKIPMIFTAGFVLYILLIISIPW
jgi:hypothetical protein